MADAKNTQTTNAGSTTNSGSVNKSGASGSTTNTTKAGNTTNSGSTSKTGKTTGSTKTTSNSKSTSKSKSTGTTTGAKTRASYTAQHPQTEGKVTVEELQSKAKAHIEAIKAIGEKAKAFKEMLSNDAIKNLDVDQIKEFHKDIMKELETGIKAQVQAYADQVRAFQESTKTEIFEAIQTARALEKETVKKATFTQAPAGEVLKAATSAEDFKYKTKYPQDLTPEDYKGQVKAKKAQIEAELAKKDPFDKTKIEAKKAKMEAAKKDFEKLVAEYEAKTAGSVQDQETVKDPARSLITSAGGKIASYVPHKPTNNLGMQFLR